jgi:hypothetical protein
MEASYDIVRILQTFPWLGILLAQIVARCFCVKRDALGLMAGRNTSNPKWTAGGRPSCLASYVNRDEKLRAQRSYLKTRFDLSQSMELRQKIRHASS